QASLRFLLYLAGRLAGLPVALVLSWRAAEPGAGADHLVHLEQNAAGSVVSLTPLSRRAVRALLTEEFGAAPAERFAGACHAVTGCCCESWPRACARTGSARARRPLTRWRAWVPGRSRGRSRSGWRGWTRRRASWRGRPRSWGMGRSCGTPRRWRE